MLMASLLVAVTSILTVPSSPNPVGDPRTVWHLVTGVPLGEFLRTRDAAVTSRDSTDLDWSSDGCSTPLPIGLGDTGRTFDFRAACTRHDFGYRNLQLLDRRYHCPRRRLDRYCTPGTWSYGRYWSAPNRRRVDDQFLADMRTDCSRRSRSTRSTCHRWARVYYRAVRIAGGP